MHVIEVLGPGCANCQRLEANTRSAVDMTGAQAQIVKVTDYAKISSYGIMSTPGLVIDGEVVSFGRVPSSTDIAEWLRQMDLAAAQAG